MENKLSGGPHRTRIYLDHNATTPVHPDVLAGLTSAAELWGNPSSIHADGREPKQILRQARQFLALALGVSPLELVFTSGASESNNSIIRGVWDMQGLQRASDQKPARDILICSTVEHPSVLRTMLSLEKWGAKILQIPVNRNGELELATYQKWLGEFGHRVALVSIMAANNETGVQFPVADLAAQAHAVGALFHSDCVQLLGKCVVKPAEWGLDFASFSSHKFYGLKGSGLTYLRQGTPCEVLIRGGGQERHRRGGTENTLGIWALGQRAQDLQSALQHSSQIAQLRDEFEAMICARLKGVTITGQGSPRLPNTSSLIIEGVDGETLLINLDILGFSVSTGAACSSGNPEPSPVLRAMGLTLAEAQSSLRVSLGLFNTKAEIELFVATLVQVVTRLRGLESSNSEMVSYEI